MIFTINNLLIYAKPKMPFLKEKWLFSSSYGNTIILMVIGQCHCIREKMTFISSLVSNYSLLPSNSGEARVHAYYAKHDQKSPEWDFLMKYCY